MRRGSHHAPSASSIAGKPERVASVPALLEQFQAAVHALITNHAESASPFLEELLQASLKQITAHDARLVEKRRVEQQQAAREEADQQLRNYVADLVARGDIWQGEEEAAAALEVSFYLIPAALQNGLLTALSAPENREEAWRRAGYGVNPPIEAREPLSVGERDRLLEQAKDVELTAQEAADELGISAATFRKHVASAKVRPVSTFVTREGWVGKKYSLHDVLSVVAPRIDQRAVQRAARQREAEREALRGVWTQLNPRQRRYLRVAYERHSEREFLRRDCRDPLALVRQTPFEGQTDGWRWMYHDEELGGYSLAERLRGLGLLDSGAGSTWVALEQRGLVERFPYAIEMESLMWGRRMVSVVYIRLTLAGRKLARAADEDRDLFADLLPGDVEAPPEEKKRTPTQRRKAEQDAAASAAKAQGHQLVRAGYLVYVPEECIGPLTELAAAGATARLQEKQAEADLEKIEKETSSSRSDERAVLWRARSQRLDAATAQVRTLIEAAGGTITDRDLHRVGWDIADGWLGEDIGNAVWKLLPLSPHAKRVRTERQRVYGPPGDTDKTGDAKKE